MATAEQIKALIRSHASEDNERFFMLALQLAAHEASLGHDALANDIRKIIDGIRRDRKKARSNPLAPGMEGLVETDLPGSPLARLVAPDDLIRKIERIIFEYRQRDKLRSFGLSPRRKILLTGPPGTGKTLTAKILAREMQLPLNTVQVDRLVTKFMGETSSRLRSMFDMIRENRGLYLFDEFDALGGGRDRNDDVGEMRRVLTALLQFIENDDSDSLIVAATNTPELLDHALFRRFDDVLVYRMPDAEEKRLLIENTTSSLRQKDLLWDTVLDASDGLSSAEVVRACRDAMKDAVLNDRSFVAEEALIGAFRERGASRGR